MQQCQNTEGCCQVTEVDSVKQERPVCSRLINKQSEMCDTDLQLTTIWH